MYVHLLLDYLYIQCISTCTCIKYNVMYHHDIHVAVKHVIVDDLEWSVEVQLAAEELNGESELCRYA